MIIRIIGCPVNRSRRLKLNMRFDVMPVATEKQIIEIEKAANQVWHNYYKDIYSEEQIDYMLQKYHSREALKQQMAEKYVYYMLLSDGDFAGYLCFKMFSDHVLISRLYIKAEYRRQGLAKKVLAIFDNISHNEEFRQIKKLKTYIERNNTFALNVYEHLGFKIVKSVDTDIGNGFFCEDYLMERKTSKN